MITRLPLTSSHWKPEFTLKPATAARDLAIADAISISGIRADRVTHLLLAVVEKLEGITASEQNIDALASGVREWLVQQVATEFLPKPTWFDATCSACENRFDISLDLAALPLSEPGKSFPIAPVPLGDNIVCFQMPNGAFERSLPGKTSIKMHELLSRLRTDEESAETNYTAELSEDDVAKIEAAIEVNAPEAVECLDVVCPDCEAITVVSCDPLTFAFPNHSDILREVHLIAQSYGWAEVDILSLPEHRRKIYLRLLNMGRAKTVHRPSLQAEIGESEQ